MKTYVLDVLENVLTEEEANQYYHKAFIEVNKREKIPLKEVSELHNQK